MATPSNPVDTEQAFPTTNTDKMIDQVETASVTLSSIILCNSRSQHLNYITADLNKIALSTINA